MNEPLSDVSVDVATSPRVPTDPMETHRTSREGLLALFSVEKPDDPTAVEFLENTFGTDGPRRMNQGNKAIARHLQGKRLCSDTEWNLACRGDPDGGPDQRDAYGDRLDLEVCNTNLAHRTACNPRGPATAWGTCSTDTEPSGAYPKCRSRFGVFDQHGNVGEVMTRREGAQTVTQLKGSAWFYVELAKEPGKPTPPSTMNKEGAYPDHCNLDPRWHVEPIDQAGHTNYHLGFRCCRAITAP